MKILFLPGSRYLSSARFRVWQFVKPLQKSGHFVKVRVIWPQRRWSSCFENRFLRRAHQGLASLSRLVSAVWALRDIKKYDIVFFHKDMIPELKIRFLEKWAAKRNPRLVFDFDDAIYLGSRGKKLSEILPFFKHVIAGNPTLASYSNSITKKEASVIPTVVDANYFVPCGQRKPGPVRIGWCGSYAGAERSLSLIQEALSQLSREEDFEFLFIAEASLPRDWAVAKMRYIPWRIQTEVANLQEIDIGVMPLIDQPFERGKCGLKAIQYMAIGIPAVVSPIGVNSEIVLHGKTGFHCVTRTDWYDTLKSLLKDEPLRLQIGRAARQHVVENYSLGVALKEMETVFQKVAGIDA